MTQEVLEHSYGAGEGDISGMSGTLQFGDFPSSRSVLLFLS